MAGKGKMSTIPYNIEQAKVEYAFISVGLFPPGSGVDEDYKGGSPGPDGPDHVAGAETLSIPGSQVGTRGPHPAS